MMSRDKLIYDLIFGDDSDFDIQLHLYMDDIYEYEEFISEVKNILRKSKVTIVSSNVEVNSKTANWKLKVKK